MISRMAALASFALSSSALACSMPTDAIQLTSTLDSAPLAYAQIDKLPLSAPFTMTVTFCNPAQEVEALMFDAVMPAHRHGMNFSVDVTGIAANRFDVSNVVFHMQGLWELRIDVEVDGQAYAYTAEVLLE